ncbi:LysR substrate-binding domain-containing protein [Rhizobium lentis]|uniref:HTH-type transcriptional regulator TtuA n=1 Tax=Rhizobium lentis TaxID=1138194 RepID=A0A9Q3M944_9HYPH|nr:LysR substrate-binding domain-containing protein [Rhizobium lentis]MBX4958667.1 LysR family transcriptional regulator [Rhizobium lentis]MBX4988779.1 LysR family transcriptional regulator [Rhizobium lentis]MBX5007228.1 LysR family transcriptional regulator [Rhizobium lentis]MBX5012522.1 LysR family transcriptional regulator [Rhizobium lentis]MBX5024120.1 LysR family transcriptional regulator [Rhizobium lentis]
MTFEQLSIFIAVAEREHLTNAASAIGLTPSAVSSAIRNLEASYGVELFHRVGRRIELTYEGRVFLGEARATLARANAAALVLSDLGGLQKGELVVFASQTIASYWLPAMLMRFKNRYPGIDLKLMIGNTTTAAKAVLDGLAEVGFVEGSVDEPALNVQPLAEDELLVVVGPRHPWARGKPIAPAELASGTKWVMREKGSGTRSAFEAAISNLGIGPGDLNVALELPSNEAVISAAREGLCATVVSGAVAAPLLAQGLLVKARFPLPSRQFAILRHKQRHSSRASLALETICREDKAAEVQYRDDWTL